jgi:PKD repeat protein
MKKVLYFIAAAAAITLAACSKPDDGKEQGGDKTPAAAPTADFSYVADGLKVTFTDKSTNATSYKWDFGDGETAKTASPTHEYAAAGTYTVKLVVANADAVTANKEASITVAGPAKAYFSYAAKTDRAGKFGLTVDFDATASENAASIAWDFGDGGTATDFKVSHVYSAYGTYKVKAEVTGIAGDKNTYETTVDVIAYNELLKGGAMEEDDAKYWTFIHTYVFPEGNYDTPDETLVSWKPYFGYTEDKPGRGEGGCLRLSSENQIHDQAYNVQFYQAIEVEEGDRLEISALMKWGPGSNDCGLLWFGIAETEDAVGMDGTSVVEMFNYWNPDWDNMRANSILPLDSGFEADEAYIADNAAREIGYSNAGEPVAVYWAQKTGTVYFYVDYRSVWGTCFGPGNDILFDNLSVKVTFEE